MCLSYVPTEIHVYFSVSKHYRKLGVGETTGQYEKGEGKPQAKHKGSRWEATCRARGRTDAFEGPTYKLA